MYIQEPWNMVRLRGTSKQLLTVLRSRVGIIKFPQSYKCSGKVPQSNILTTVIFLFDHVQFLAFFVQHRNYWLATKRVFLNPFCGQTNYSFVALTQCNKKIPIKCQKMPKKETQSKCKITVVRQFDWGTFCGDLAEKMCILQHI